MQNRAVNSSLTYISVKVSWTKAMDGSLTSQTRQTMAMEEMLELHQTLLKFIIYGIISWCTPMLYLAMSNMELSRVSKWKTQSKPWVNTWLLLSVMSLWSLTIIADWRSPTRVHTCLPWMDRSPLTALPTATYSSPWIEWCTHTLPPLVQVWDCARLWSKLWTVIHIKVLMEILEQLYLLD